MLGSNLGIPEVKSHFGLADRGTRFWSSPLWCRGDEETLEDCEEGEKHDCALGEVAGVVCYFGDETQQTTTTVATKSASPVLQSMRAREPGLQAPSNLTGSKIKNTHIFLPLLILSQRYEIQYLEEHLTR